MPRWNTRDCPVSPRTAAKRWMRAPRTPASISMDRQRGAKALASLDSSGGSIVGLLHRPPARASRGHDLMAAARLKTHKWSFIIRKMDISVTQFKHHCLEIIRRLEQTGAPVAITRRGKVVAQLNAPAVSKSGRAQKPW